MRVVFNKTFEFTAEHVSQSLHPVNPESKSYTPGAILHELLIGVRDVATENDILIYAEYLKNDSITHIEVFEDNDNTPIIITSDFSKIDNINRSISRPEAANGKLLTTLQLRKEQA